MIEEEKEKNEQNQFQVRKFLRRMFLPCSNSHAQHVSNGSGETFFSSERRINSYMLSFRGDEFNH